MLDVTVANFEKEVIEASLSVPVLVDFWAPWCGPCKSLGPVLEKVEADYAGRFKLVKINTEEEQQLAAAFGIRSIPTCVMMINGQPVDGFMGAQPESQVRAFVDKHVPEAAPQLPEEDESAPALEDGDVLAQLSHQLAQDPSNNDVRFELVKTLITQGHFEEAEAALAPGMAQIPLPLRFEALHQWLNALIFAATDPRGQWSQAQFSHALSENKRDFETRFAKARVLLAVGHWPEALDELLEIIMRDKKWGDEAPRRTYVGLLELMTPTKKAGPADTGKSAGGIELAGAAAQAADPQMELINRYRRKLSMALN